MNKLIKIIKKESNKGESSEYKKQDSFIDQILLRARRVQNTLGAKIILT